MPFGNEVDIMPLIATLRQRKYRVFIPFIQEFSFKMIPLRLPLHKNAFGIYESNNSHFNLIKVDVVIIPVLGIDKLFRRIGFGRGMYDRFISALKDKIQIIFVARSANYVLDVITQDYDVQGDEAWQWNEWELLSLEAAGNDAALFMAVNRNLRNVRQLPTLLRIL